MTAAAGSTGPGAGTVLVVVGAVVAARSAGGQRRGRRRLGLGDGAGGGSTASAPARPAPTGATGAAGGSTGGVPMAGNANCSPTKITFGSSTTSGLSTMTWWSRRRRGVVGGQAGPLQPGLGEVPQVVVELDHDRLRREVRRRGLGRAGTTAGTARRRPAAPASSPTRSALGLVSRAPSACGRSWLSSKISRQRSASPSCWRASPISVSPGCDQHRSRRGRRRRRAGAATVDSWCGGVHDERRLDAPAAERAGARRRSPSRPGRRPAGGQDRRHQPLGDQADAGARAGGRSEVDPTGRGRPGGRPQLGDLGAQLDDDRDARSAARRSQASTASTPTTMRHLVAAARPVLGPATGCRRRRGAPAAPRRRRRPSPGAPRALATMRRSELTAPPPW